MISSAVTMIPLLVHPSSCCGSFRTCCCVLGEGIRHLFSLKESVVPWGETDSPGRSVMWGHVCESIYGDDVENRKTGTTYMWSEHLWWWCREQEDWTTYMWSEHLWWWYREQEDWTAYMWSGMWMKGPWMEAWCKRLQGGLIQSSISVSLP